MNSVVELKHISKEFPGVKVLDDINLSLYPGEVLGICGENGAGKSTLIKILTGLYQPNGGVIEFEGQEVKLNAIKSRELGISAIYQELTIVPELSLAENLFLGHPPVSAKGIVDYKKLYADSREVLKELGINASPDKVKAGDLGIGSQQLIEVGRAIGRKSKVLIMDEPTSSLSHQDTLRLYGLIRKFRDQGYAIIFISHHMEEIFEITDRVAVLRDGKVIDVKPTKEWTVDDLVFAMVNRRVDQQFPAKEKESGQGEVILELKNVSNHKVHNINLKIRAGEIVGIAGINGAGRTELLKTIYGFYPYTEGEMYFKGKPLKTKSIRKVLDQGIVMVSEDRKKEGLILSQDCQQNIALSHYKELASHGVVNEKKVRKMAEEGVRKYDVKTPSLAKETGKLSGGNQQKLILARITYGNPVLFLLDEPTRGIDVAVKMEMYKQMIAFAEAGAAVIMVSSELPEVLGMADRVLVMHEHTIVADIPREKATSELVMNYATGGK
ncbi:sugar ABC transporter ATP-binding protein [Hominifimenecus sp. rT4P-3]|uniref:sugar ABC transporter ATP-binding protein n=1 Tax=Hominifimenecus sp. rT4P-3 TaxID=3242979 RepID=UPI003DA625E6